MLTALERPTISQVLSEAGEGFDAWMSDRAQRYGTTYDKFRASLDELLAAGLLRWDGSALSINCGQHQQTVYGGLG